jgi:hypothetical protein
MAPGILPLIQSVRPALERFYKSLSDEQKARFNAIAPADDADAAGKDRRDLAKFCDERAKARTMGFISITLSGASTCTARCRRAWSAERKRGHALTPQQLFGWRRAAPVGPVSGSALRW